MKEQPESESPEYSEHAGDIGAAQPQSSQRTFATADPELAGLFVAPAEWCYEFCRKADIWLAKREDGHKNLGWKNSFNYARRREE